MGEIYCIIGWCCLRLYVVVFVLEKVGYFLYYIFFYEVGQWSGLVGFVCWVLVLKFYDVYIVGKFIRDLLFVWFFVFVLDVLFGVGVDNGGYCEVWFF